MPYAVFIIRTDGRVEKTVQPKAPTYDQQTKAVGGFIETVPYFTKMTHDGVLYTRGTAYANEEGRLHGLPINRSAMTRWQSSCPGGDPSRMTLCGDVIFYARVKE
jgi:hypothetical protein